jgi:hypothetical protein
MPVLTEANRLLIVEEITSKNLSGEIDSLTDEDLLALVAAIDDWIIANQVDFNATLPQPARGVLTTRQKAWVFSLILRRRWRVNA